MSDQERKRLCVQPHEVVFMNSFIDLDPCVLSNKPQMLWSALITNKLLSSGGWRSSVSQHKVERVFGLDGCNETRTSRNLGNFQAMTVVFSGRTDADLHSETCWLCAAVSLTERFEPWPLIGHLLYLSVKFRGTKALTGLNLDLPEEEDEE